MIPKSDWYWCGYPGHFVAARHCRFFLHTRVGGYRVSTVGDYYPHGERGPASLRGTLPHEPAILFETMVFPLSDHDFDQKSPEGVVMYWHPYEQQTYHDSREAERGHHRMCERIAAIPRGRL